MNVLVIGSGGREHALGWKISLSTEVEEVFYSPGNGGTTKNIGLNDFEAIVKFVSEKKVGLVVVGPEIPLVDGITDYLVEKDILVFGPSKDGAILEGSKAYSKDFMKKFNIPTAGYEKFTEADKAKAYLKTLSAPYVIKASGLAGGKGAIIAETLEDALKTIDEIMVDKAFGGSGDTIVIEEFMTGEEASIFVITDGENYRILPPSQDHKRVGEGDTGLNTGGMGAYCPAGVVTDSVLKQVKKEVIEPTLKGMKEEGRFYKGLLYVGVMIENSYAKVVEYNCRFGDPETECVVVAMQEDIFPYLLASANGTLGELPEINLKGKKSATVVVSALGYPETYPKGMEIKLPAFEDTQIFHAGTKMEDGKLLSTGGRILNVVAEGATYDEVFEKIYKTVDKIEMDNMYVRRDIGHRVRTK